MNIIQVLEIANLMLEISSNFHNLSGKEALTGIAFIGTLILVLSTVKNVNININVNFNKSEENKRK